MCKCQINRIFMLLFIFLFVFVINAGADELYAQRIGCKDGIHSYAVYLPPDYDKSKEYPVLFCFDPMGQGDYAAKLFSSASVNYGWIVAGSLDAKNGPWELILDAQNAMLEDITSRYQVDEQCLYAAGFSGGARMSYTMAYKYPRMFKGIIACGAGFGEGKISKEVAVFHCAGSDGFNYREIREAHSELASRGVKSKMRVFQGAHEWPPEKVILEALEWISKI